MPISGWLGDNLLKKSANMPWWKGVDVQVLGDANKKVHIDTLHDALDKMVQQPARKSDVAMRTPLSGVYKINGVGDVLTGRVEQVDHESTGEKKTQTQNFVLIHSGRCQARRRSNPNIIIIIVVVVVVLRSLTVLKIR